MPRRLRIENPGGFFHIAARGVDKDFIFREVHDRRAFLALLFRTAITYEWSCQGYCLMGTHFHLIVQTMRATLSRGMHALCGTYAQRFNKRHERRGHLFGNRFLGVAIESDRHLLAAHRYVALNPQRAGLCESPSRWRWSSYRAIVNQEPAEMFLEPSDMFLDVAGALRLFDDRPDVARVLFRRFVEHPTPAELAESYALAEIDGV